MNLLRPRRFLEALLILVIVLAYLLVLTRGQIVDTLAGSSLYPMVAAAPAIARPSLGENAP